MTDSQSPRPGADHTPPGRQQRSPFVVRCEAGRYAWCRCGTSRRYPYCDGSHNEKAPGVTPLKVQLEEAGTVVWCACGATGNPPYCDGSHGRLP